jgi:hypothetical protein
LSRPACPPQGTPPPRTLRGVRCGSGTAARGDAVRTAGVGRGAVSRSPPNRTLRQRPLSGGVLPPWPRVHAVWMAAVRRGHRRQDYRTSSPGGRPPECATAGTPGRPGGRAGRQAMRAPRSSPAAPTPRPPRRSAHQTAGPGVAVLPAADDRAGGRLRVDPDLGPGVKGPGTQLHGEVGQEHQIVGRPVGMAGHQLVQPRCRPAGERRGAAARPAPPLARRPARSGRARPGADPGSSPAPGRVPGSRRGRWRRAAPLALRCWWMAGAPGYPAREG